MLLACGTALASTGPGLLCDNPKEILPRFHFNNAGLLVVVTNLSDPVDQCQCLRKVKVLLQLRLVSYNQADSSASAKHNYTFLAQNITHSLSKFCFPLTLPSDTSLHHLYISKYFSFPSFHKTIHEALNRQWLFQSKFPKSFHNLPQNTSGLLTIPHGLTSISVLVGASIDILKHHDQKQL